MICVLIPALNEESHLRTLLPLIPDRLLGIPVNVVVVSDGSTDATKEVVKLNGALLVELPMNRGKGAALRAGWSRAVDLPCEYLVTMDGDGQHDPADLERLIGPVMHGGYDATFGSRYLNDPTCGETPINRYLVRRATVAYLKRTSARTFTDPFCGYRCFTRRALDHIRFAGDGYHCELEAIFDVCIHDLRVVDVPVKKIYGRGTSKMGARGGAFLGRIRVLSHYLSTVSRKSRDLRRARADRRRPSHVHRRASGTPAESRERPAH